MSLCVNITLQSYCYTAGFLCRVIKILKKCKKRTLKGVFILTLSNALKFFRTQRDIKQSDLAENDRSNYSRIENGKAKVPVEHLKTFTDKLSITVSELILYSGLDNDFLYFQKAVKEALIQPQNLTNKHKILELYLDLHPNKNKNNKQLAMYYTIIASFSATYSEIEKLTKDDINYSFSHLIRLPFHTQYDYLLAVNMISYYTLDQIRSITKAMFPIQDPQKRTVETLKYANLLMINTITMEIYNLDYDFVLKFIGAMEKEKLIYENHYYRFLMTYYKHLTNYLKSQDQYSLGMAKQYLIIIQDMYDHNTYEAFKKEQENLIYNPRYYLDLKTFETTNIKD